ncbi:MAG: type II toxin-antitoxin system RelE/ParE family toxin [Ruminococcus sp.]|nr:type II toxin-antitoxin system RelE/ParE family toxin [Ruminococcus sp.]
MKKYKLIIEPLAQEDIIDIVNYIKEVFVEPQIASRYYTGIKTELYTLSEFPKRYRPILTDRFPNEELRMIQIKNYGAFYTVDEKEREVKVIRVLYARRNWQSLLNR